MFIGKSSIKVVSISALVLSILAGCATNTPQPTAQPENTTNNIQPSENKQVEQQLSAIEALLAQHQVEEAQIIINGLQFEQLNTAEKTRYVLAQADIALILGEGQAALQWIGGQYSHLFDGLPLDQQVEISLKRAEAHEFSGQPLAAARERIFLAPILSDEQYQLNHEQIWFDLQLVDETQLRELAESESSPDLTGWIELSLINQSYSDDLYRQLSAIQSWQKRHRSHPAAKLLPGSLQMLAELVSNQPKQLAVLLPLSGTLEKVGNAVRNGILASWYQAKENGLEVPTLRFYDTEDSEDVLNLYLQSVAEGAETIIGPLAKARVQRLASAEELPVPVLALNIAFDHIDKPNFFQFGLPPEDEAAQVADDLWLQGARQVMVVAPDSAWGHRVSDAFISNWQLKGGVITSKALFGKPDQYLTSIQRALNINKSAQRHALISRTLGEEPEFEFRRRQDIDMIFMAAFPAQARQLKPIINYQRAANVPVVATSSLFSGQEDIDKDKDLDGVRFVEMPWRLLPSPLKTQVNEAFPESMSNYATLVALGIDAYRLFARLPQMAAFNDVHVQGVTGDMTMASGQRIARQLNWAEIDQGRIVPLTNLEN